MIAIREFLWAEGDALSAILERRRRYRAAFEDLIAEGVARGRMAVANPKIAAFSIIEMAEGVPRWFRADGDVSINQWPTFTANSRYGSLVFYNVGSARQVERVSEMGFPGRPRLVTVTPVILDRFRLDDKVAVITGAGRGLGAAIALAFAEAGADVVIASRTEAQLEAVAEQVRLPAVARTSSPPTWPIPRSPRSWPVRPLRHSAN